MSGLFKRGNLGQTEPAIGDLDVQTSAYGMAIGVVYGRRRIPLHLIWYGDFKATPQEERQEVGKGGSPPSRTFYIYSASIIASVGEGPVSGIRRVWKGKQRFDAVASGNVKISKSESHVVPASPFAVTVDSAATWADNISVMLRGRYNLDPWAQDEPLQSGTDYTYNAGVYTFTAAVEGRTVDIRYSTTEVTPAESALGQLGLTLVPYGGPDAGIWAHLTSNHPAEAVPYAGLAYVRAQDYPLTDYARVENHLVEVDGRLQSELGYPDCNHADVFADILTNPNYGLGFPTSMLGDLSAWRTLVDAAALWVSPAYLSQRAAREQLKELLDTGFAKAVWTGKELKVIPVWDDVIGPYTPNMTPVFDLGEDDLIAEKGEMAIEVQRSGIAEAPNFLPIEYADRAQDYQTQVVEWRDESAEIAFGRKAESARTFHLLPSADLAQRVAAMLGQQMATQQDKFAFRLPAHYIELQPGDLVTLTEASQGLDRETVMVESITESDDGTFEIEAFGFPIGVANSPLIAPPVGSGHIPNWNEAPGSVNTPTIVEPPGGFVTGGLEVWVAASGGAAWGGADIYASIDGASYKQVGTINQHCRHGTVTAVQGAGADSIVTVQLENNSVKLRSVSAADAASGRSLCFFGPVVDGEFVSFQTATLIAAGTYQLGGLRRGQHGTDITTIEVGDAFTVLDQSLATSGPLDPDIIGKTISFKLVSFNRYGGGLESLATVSVYTHTVRGRFMDQAGLPFVPNLIANAGFEFDLSDWEFIKWQSDSNNYLSALIDPVNRIAGVPSNATIRQVERMNVNTIASLRSRVMQVQPDRDYIIYAKLLPVNCSAELTLLTMGADGNINNAGQHLSRIVTAKADSGDPNDYELVVHRISPPAGTRFIAMRIDKHNSPAAGESLVRILEPFGGQAIRGQHGTPPWNNGTTSTTGTKGIAAGSVERTHTLSMPAAVTISGTNWQAVANAVFTSALDDEQSELIATLTIDASVIQAAAAGEIFVQALCYCNTSESDPQTVVGAYSIGNGNTLRGSTSLTIPLGKSVAGINIYGISARMQGASGATAVINAAKLVVREKLR